MADLEIPGDVRVLHQPAKISGGEHQLEDVVTERRLYGPIVLVQPLEFTFNGRRIGVTVCEDVWNDRDFWTRRRYHFDPIEELARAGADVIVNLAEEGNGFPWHFDTNNYTVTLAIQNAEEGGDFEYSPYLRTPTDENYEGVERVRADFPLLGTQVHGKPLVYLDNAATTQKPRVVIESQVRYYENLNANVHRGVHLLSQRASDKFDDARRKVQKFLGAAHSKEVIFTRGTTESINLVASSFGRKFVAAGDEIVITDDAGNRICTSRLTCLLRDRPTS